jgi:exopolyphosphatase/pppGpp-phosphohydrolase
MMALGDEGVAEAHEKLRSIEETRGFVRLTQTVLQRASLPMATKVRTLDALHIASALCFQERRGQTMTFATHDGRQATAARALGFAVIGV